MSIRREPALLLALVASLVQMVSAFVTPLNVEQQGVINAAAIAIAGLITAIMVRFDQLVPTILGVVQAGLALGLAFGLDVTPENQSVIMAFTAAAVGMFVRTQVTAPVPAATTVNHTNHAISVD